MADTPSPISRSVLSTDMAFAVASTLKQKANDYEKRAAEFDRWQTDKVFTPATRQWASDQQSMLRERAATFRTFASEVVQVSFQ
nr:hypothetical protein [uncultured Brevundimonas sp.]